MIEDSIKCYQILGLEPGATAQKIRSVYLELAQTWDPDRYAHNPRLREEAKKKRSEIDDAYKSICFFLPELKGSSDPVRATKRVAAVGSAISHGPQLDRTKMLLGVLVACVLAFVTLWANRLYQQSQNLAPASNTTIPDVP